MLYGAQDNLSHALAVGYRIDWRNVVALQETTELLRVIFRGLFTCL